ncbi:hypothetical protein Patl1_23534 [Pistacia atlantica]|uniref:Uncharacterized protein n=1 Tax=Pistacia atlantica TaxID=434234 RepID=A0ACC0ZZW5_9ROSI|nr:hypothetical protein Patl1_23534 [Pistacia atlantica]
MGTKFSVLLLLFILFPLALAQLKVGFYNSTCPRAESIIGQIVAKRFNTTASGCDASILIDSTNTTQSEKDAGANQTVREFELIDEAKLALEKECPSTVSCADIITLATRDAVALSKGPFYAVPTGRRDGLASNPDEVFLPGPTISVSDAINVFAAKKLTVNNMVALLGGHTVGVAHCSFFEDRLSNFQGTNAPDPTMDPALVAELKRICSGNNDPTAFLDQGTPFVLDNQFYNQTLFKRGVMQIDQRLASDKSTSGIVSGFASNNAAFRLRFAEAMVKMGSIEVLVGNNGQIRQNCRVVNQGKPLSSGNLGQGKPKKPVDQPKPKKQKSKTKRQKPKPKRNPKNGKK